MLVLVTVLVMKAIINVGQHHSGISSFNPKNFGLMSFASEADLVLGQMQKPLDTEQVVHPSDTILWIRCMTKKIQRRNTL